MPKPNDSMTWRELTLSTAWKIHLCAHQKLSLISWIIDKSDLNDVSQSIFRFFYRIPAEHFNFSDESYFDFISTVFLNISGFVFFKNSFVFFFNCTIHKNRCHGQIFSLSMVFFLLLIAWDLSPLAFTYLPRDRPVAIGCNSSSKGCTNKNKICIADRRWFFSVLALTLELFFNLVFCFLLITSRISSDWWCKYRWSEAVHRRRSNDVSLQINVNLRGKSRNIFSLINLWSQSNDTGRSLLRLFLTA